MLVVAVYAGLNLSSSIVSRLVTRPDHWLVADLVDLFFLGCAGVGIHRLGRRIRQDRLAAARQVSGQSTNGGVGEVDSER